MLLSQPHKNKISVKEKRKHYVLFKYLTEKFRFLSVNVKKFKKSTFGTNEKSLGLPGEEVGADFSSPSSKKLEKPNHVAGFVLLSCTFSSRLFPSLQDQFL